MVKTRKVDLRKVYTDLSLQRRVAEAHGIEKKPIQDLAEMLREVKMGEDTPLRLLLRGRNELQYYWSILETSCLCTQVQKFVLRMYSPLYFR